MTTQEILEELTAAWPSLSTRDQPLLTSAEIDEALRWCAANGAALKPGVHYSQAWALFVGGVAMGQRFERERKGGEAI